MDQLPKFKTKLGELFEYNFQMNEVFINLYLDNLNLVTERISMLIDHTLNAHQIWNARVLNQIPFDRFQVNANDSLKVINQENFQNSLLIINNKDLEEVVMYHTSTGDCFYNSIEDILLHAFNHSTYHRGQIATDFKKVGVPPPISDYILYKRMTPIL